MSRTPDDGSGPLDVDAAFAEIVAHWGDDVAGSERPAGSGPADGPRTPDDTAPAAPDDDTDTDDGHTDGTRDTEDTGDTRDADVTGTGEDRSPRHLAGAQDTGEAPEDRTRLVRPAAPLPPPPREDVPSSQWFATPRQRDDEPAELRALGEDRFVPADPSPLPRDVVGWAAWIAVVGSPLFLLVVALGWNDVPQLMTAVTAAVFVAGFATLVIRLPGSRDDDDDDGAVV